MDVRNVEQSSMESWHDRVLPNFKERTGSFLIWYRGRPGEGWRGFSPLLMHSQRFKGDKFQNFPTAYPRPPYLMNAYTVRLQPPHSRTCPPVRPPWGMQQAPRTYAFRRAVTSIESAVTGQNDEFKASFDSSYSRLFKTSKLSQETQYLASILSDTFIKCICRSISCALGKWSLHSRWNLISTELHACERWPIKWRQLRISAVSMQHR